MISKKGSAKAKLSWSFFPHGKKGGALMTIAVVILILIAIGLWLYPNFTKDVVTGAVTKVKSLVHK